jgi:urease accessory protein
MNTSFSNSTHSVTGSTLSGHLRLRCECRADGTPYVSEQQFRAPIHIGKGHLAGKSLLLNITNPTAGFFDGDQVASQITVGSDAHLVLSTPAASRVFRTRSGSPAVHRQSFHVEENGLLEWIPEPFIPHAGASYVQSTTIDLHPQANLLFFEWLAPGRVAMGEMFAYKQLQWKLDLRVGGALIARERYTLQPENHSLEALQARFPAAHYVSMYAAGSMTQQWPATELDALSSDDISIGHGALRGGVYVIRALCRDGMSARKLIEHLRQLHYTHAELTTPSLGRVPS